MIRSSFLGLLFAGALHAQPAQPGSVAAMEQIAEHALVPPALNTSPLPEYGYDQLDYGMTIGIERTPGGRLWACWVAGGDSPDAFFVLATSDDEGDSWSDPRLVVDSHDPALPRKRSVLVGNLWTDPLGRLWLIFDQSMDMFDGRGGVWLTRCDNPDAEQPVWTPPRRIGHGVCLNKPTVLSTGEWMMPLSLDQRGGLGAFKGCFKQLDPQRGAHVFVSTDQGETWSSRGKVQFPKPNWHEHMVVERKDASLWMLGRTGNGIMESTSQDRGTTWSEPVLSNIKHPVARFFIRRLASGRILLVKHGDRIDAHAGRVQLSAWLSMDEGQSWQGGLVLDERPGISYPDGFQAPDGTLFISYDRNRAVDGEILLARFTEQDVLTKSFSGPKSNAKILISRPLKKDRIEASELLDNAGAAKRIEGPAAELVPEDGEIRTLKKGGLLYSNRDYVIHQLPAGFEGKRFVFSTIESSQALCKKAGVVYVFSPTPGRNRRDNVEAELIAQGFAKAAVPEFVIKKIQGRARPEETCSVYQKRMQAGERVRFKKWGVIAF